MAWSDQHYIQGLSNAPFSVSEVGGFGYRVNRLGWRTGGFGYALYSPQEGTPSLSGGVGGAIFGRETRAGPLCLAANLWAGLGGVSTTNLVGTQTGFAIVFAEANLEFGIALTPWMQFSTYAGMQGLADLSPHSGIGSRFATYSPVVGMQLSWGSFMHGVVE